MNAQNVRIVRLSPMRVASALAFGPSPEEEAWGKLVRWAASQGFLEAPAGHRIFGFNNPSPSPGSPNYGYEFWMEIGPEVEAQEEGEVELKQFAGGLYAVARCEVQGDPARAIPAAWEALALWREGSAYQAGGHQWLEERLPLGPSPEGAWDLDLYLPIAE
jgi:DNA gyrase inhibitor GyrI